MAVFTELTDDEVRAFVAGLQAGELQAVQPVHAGIENTNYFVTTSSGSWVLTLFERLTHAQLPFYLRLMQHLARHRLPVPGGSGCVRAYSSSSSTTMRLSSGFFSSFTRPPWRRVSIDPTTGADAAFVPRWPRPRQRSSSGS